jgi:hypothetical protein
VDPGNFALVRGEAAVGKLTMIIAANFAIVVWTCTSEKLPGLKPNVDRNFPDVHEPRRTSSPLALLIAPFPARST